MDSIKDSFSRIDPGALGLMVLFEVSWIWCEAEQQDMPPTWVRINNGADLSDWHTAWTAWKDDGSAADQVFFHLCASMTLLMHS